MPDFGGATSIWDGLMNDIEVALDESAPVWYNAMWEVGGTVAEGLGVGLLAFIPDDLVALAIVLVAIIIAVGFNYIIAKPIAWALHFIPVIGQPAADAVTTAGNAEQNFIMGLLNWIWTNFINFITGLFHTVIGFITGIPNAIAWVAHQVQFIAGEGLNFVFTEAANYANNLYNQATLFVAHYVDPRVQGLQSEISAAVNEEQDLFNRAIAHADAAATSAANHANDLYNQVENDLHNDVNLLQQTIGDVVQKVELEIGHATSTAEQYTNAVVNGVVGSLNVEIAGVEVGLATATAVLLQRIQNVESKVCPDVCDAQGTNSRNLKSLGSLGTTAAFLAFLYAAIKDPKPTADISADVLQPVAGLAGGILDGLVGAVV